MRLFALILIFFFFNSPARTQKIQKFDTDDSKEFKAKALKFMVFGDWGRNGEDNQKEVALEMAIVARKFKPDFFISTGDNFYPNGVRSTRDYNWIASFEKIYTAQVLQSDWFVVLGNHDYLGDPQAEIDYSAIDRRWNMPARYYSRVFFIDNDTSQGVLLVFLDTTPFLSESYIGDRLHVQDQDTSAQKAWLEKTLGETTPNIKWKLVFGHHPVYTGGGRMTALETGEMKKLFEPIFEKYHVNAYICGHDHNLQYIKPPGFTNYFVSGAGSEISKTVIHPEGGVFARSENGFMNFKIYANELQVTVISYTGAHLYSATIPRQ